MTGKTIAISNVDSLIGCAVACHVACVLEKQCPDVRIIALAKNPDKVEKIRKHKNVHVEKLDYNDVNSIQNALKGTGCILIVPEMDENRTVMNSKLVEAINHCGIKSAILLSCLGSESGKHELQSFHDIERQVQDNVDCYVILRKGVLHQCFRWWSKAVQERGEFPLSIDENSKFSPLNLCDYIKAIEMIILEHCKKRVEGDDPKFILGGKHHNKIYNLTGPRAYNGENLVQELNRAVGNKDDPVKFKKVSREELEKILEENIEHTSTLDEFDFDQCENLMMAKGGYQFKPNKVMIRILLDEFEWINEGEAGFVSDDLRNITGHEGKKLEDYFTEEKDYFRHRK